MYLPWMNVSWTDGDLERCFQPQASHWCPAKAKLNPLSPCLVHMKVDPMFDWIFTMPIECDCCFSYEWQCLFVLKWLFEISVQCQFSGEGVLDCSMAKSQWSKHTSKYPYTQTHTHTNTHENTHKQTHTHIDAHKHFISLTLLYLIFILINSLQTSTLTP